VRTVLHGDAGRLFDGDCALFFVTGPLRGSVRFMRLISTGVFRPILVRLAVATIAVTGAAPVAQAAEPESITDDLQVSPLGDGVWRHTSWNTYKGGRVPSNGLIVREGDGLVLIDTAWGVQATLDLVAWIDANLKLPITHAIITHSHDDRLGGAVVLVERGIPFSGHPLTAEIARRTNKPAPAVLDTLHEPGSTTVVGALVVMYPGPGHTVDNLTVWLPRARVLAGGCAVKSLDATDLGYIGEADFAAWPDSMRRVLGALPTNDPVVVVPGHGDPGGRELLTHTIELLRIHATAAP